MWCATPESNLPFDHECTETDGAKPRNHAIKSFKVLVGSTAATIAAKWFEDGGIVLVSEDKHDESHLMGRPSKKSKVASSAAPPPQPQPLPAGHVAAVAPPPPQ